MLFYVDEFMRIEGWKIGFNKSKLIEKIALPCVNQSDFQVHFYALRNHWFSWEQRTNYISALSFVSVWSFCLFSRQKSWGLSAWVWFAGGKEYKVIQPEGEFHYVEGNSSPSPAPVSTLTAPSDVQWPSFSILLNFADLPLCRSQSLAATC